MTMDKSLKMRVGLTRARSVLNRAERIQRLKAADRWKEGDSPFGLPKVRVFKLAMKVKKKKKEEEATTEGAEDAAAPAADVAKKEAPKKDTSEEKASPKLMKLISRNRSWIRLPGLSLVSRKANTPCRVMQAW